VNEPVLIGIGDTFHNASAAFSVTRNEEADAGPVQKAG
jgi:uroporphyrin-III C-methyltransferase/precorrin-2 dehydrogenase/sirohydrochlorin ferrochelatase